MKKEKEKKEEKKFEFDSYKKLLIFGAKNTGKTSLSKTFDEKKETDTKKEKGKKNNLYNI